MSVGHSLCPTSSHLNQLLHNKHDVLINRMVTTSEYEMYGAVVNKLKVVLPGGPHQPYKARIFLSNNLTSFNRNVIMGTGRLRGYLILYRLSFIHSLTAPIHTYTP